MEQRAGRARFWLPDTWIDSSTYTYYSPDRSWKITLAFDTEVDEPTADAVIGDRLEIARDILPGFRIVQEPMPVQFARREGRTVTFDNRDSDRTTRNRLLVVLLAPRHAIVVTAQGPANAAAGFDATWEAFVSSFVLDQQA